MNDPNYSVVRGRSNTMTWGVIAAVVAIIIVVGAIFACNNSISSNTSGDDTRPVVNNAPPAANINTIPPQSIRGLVVLTNIAFLTV
jgi:hypothetical protein